jgi:hypothetical protein
VTPFVDALTTAGRAAATESAGDPKVIAVLELGWLMKELAQGWLPEPMPDGLPLDEAQQRQAQALQLTALLGTLKLAGLDSAGVDAVTRALQDGPANEAAGQLQSTVMVALLGADARLPKAYALGGGLRVLIPNEGSDEGEGWPGATAEPTKSLVGALDSLSSALPSHAARSVAISLGEWSQSQDTSKAELADSQVKLWRSVLVGEKKGTELLEPDDYVEAAKQLERRFASRALKSKWLWVVAGIAFVLFWAGIYFLFNADGHAGKVAAGASGVLAALGLTWKGIGGTLGKLVGKLEAPLWGAELDTAITDAMTLTKAQNGDPATPKGLGYADRRERAAPTRPASTHAAN